MPFIDKLARKKYINVWNKKNRGKIRGYQKKYHTNNKSECESRRLKQMYGITSAQKEQMIAAQDGRCAICDSEFKNTKDTSVDHDHRTDKIRGILCMACNQGLGRFGDNVYSLQGAIKYLKSWI